MDREIFDEIIYSAEKFKWPEYLVFIAILLASLGIGVYYGFFGSKNKTNEEFLMAGRSMSVFPVAMSLICSFVSAITLLGQPAEIFYYGIQLSISALSIIPMTFVLAYLFVPVYVDLQLTSAYQYFEWRFSRRVRTIASVFALIYLMFYMPTSVLGPSLALDQVAGIHYGIIAASTFVVCTIYSSIGGLKAVLWTDTLQAVVMLVSLVLVLAFGIHEVGGLGFIWETAKNYDRVGFWNPDADPRTRFTVWSIMIGEFFTWLSLFGATQAQIQRYNSVPSLRAARITLFCNMIGMMTIITLCSVIGLMIFGKYYNCDPVKTEAVNSSDQLVPFFVLQVLGKYSGVPGILVAGLICGSLSTVSSALNALSAIITEDYVKRYRPNTSEEKLALISKLVSVVAGAVGLGLLFVIAIVNESVALSPFATFLIGSLMGPILGMFALGIWFPWTNEMGTILGVILSLIIATLIGLGSVIASLQDKLPNQKLIFGDCTISNASEFETTSMQSYVKPDWKIIHQNDSFLIKLFSMSYLYQTALSTICTIVFGLIFSFSIIFISRKKPYEKVNVRLLSGPMLRLWTMMIGKSRMENWVDYEYFDFGDKAVTTFNKVHVNPTAVVGENVNNNNIEKELELSGRRLIE